MIDHVFWWTGLVTWAISGACGILWAMDQGATVAIKRTFQHLLDAGDVQEAPKAQMIKDFGRTARAFIVTNAEKFV